MKRVLVIALLALLVLAACDSKTTGKRVAIPQTSGSAVTGAVTGSNSQSPTAQQTDVSSGKSAAEALKELKTTGTVPTNSNAKSGNFYPPITTSATGAEALKQKTRALFNQSVYSPQVSGTEKDFGAKYHSDDGDPTNLPSGYTDNDGD
ncbi:hypothetical protein HY489_01235 [Candidatus Woesearchaeota archaeon]|nr:hypothetical protein [Candidatus Woesearchaeota archaeon]